MSDEEFFERYKDVLNLSTEEMTERMDKHILEKTLHSVAVREAIKHTHEASKKVREGDGNPGIEACVQVMVVNAASELGGALTKKEMKQLESIAMRVISEVIGEE